jgi:hypothetical protein
MEIGMAREQLVNNAITSLPGAITGEQTSITVSDASAFPTSGNFIIIIDDEIILVKSVSGNTFTLCVRGYEDTSNVSHSSGATVAHVVTAGSLERYIRGSVPFFDDANIPLVNHMEDSNGAILDASDFTAINQGSSTLTDYSSGGVCLYVPSASTNNVRLYVRNAPSTPYTVTAMARGFLPSSAGMFGIGFRQSSNSKILVVTRVVSGVAAQKWTENVPDELLLGSVYATYSGLIWFKIEDDGTDLTLYTSHDGEHWLEVFSESRGTFLTPDQICIAGNDSTVAIPFYVSFHTWIED